MKPSIPILGFLVSCLLTTHASAAEGQPFQELQRQIDALKLEVERLKSPAVAYNGVACQPAIPFWVDFLIYNPQGVFTVGPVITQTVGVTCPIARTKVGSTRGARVDVVVTRGGPEDIDVFCTLASWSSDGFMAITSDGQTADLSEVLSAVIQLSVDRIEPDGFLSLTCNLPGHYSIAQYVVREQ
jgi:hypothetical protein